MQIYIVAVCLDSCAHQSVMEAQLCQRGGHMHALSMHMPILVYFEFCYIHLNSAHCCSRFIKFQFLVQFWFNSVQIQFSYFLKMSSISYLKVKSLSALHENRDRYGAALQEYSYFHESVLTQVLLHAGQAHLSRLDLGWQGQGFLTNLGFVIVNRSYISYFIKKIQAHH